MVPEKASGELNVTTLGMLATLPLRFTGVVLFSNMVLDKVKLPCGMRVRLSEVRMVPAAREIPSAPILTCALARIASTKEQKMRSFFIGGFEAVKYDAKLKYHSVVGT